MSYSSHGFIGRLTKDPEVRRVTIKGQEVAVANFTVACDHEIGDGTDFYNVVAWRGLAETIEKYLAKGRLVFVEGRPGQRSYEVTREGVTFNQYVQEVQATKVQFLEKPKTAGQYTEPTQEQQEQLTEEPSPF